MRVILYMAISINGMIAKNDDDTSWISIEEWNNYSQAVQNAGCLIVGRRTYEILTKQPEFREFKDVKVVVVSNTNIQMLSRNHFLVDSPKAALETTKEYECLIVAGGGILNAAFLEEKLVDEIYLDIEPIVIGEGTPLFKDKKFSCNLKFLGQKKLSENEIQLHYKVLKN